MGRVNPIHSALTSEPFEVTWKPKGNSMTPLIKSGTPVRIKKIDSSKYRVGDIVYCKVVGNFYLHLITAFDESKNRYQISNNHGHVNGWTSAENIFGLCVEIDGEIKVSDEEIERR